MKATRYSNRDATLQLAVIPVFVLLQNWILLGRTFWQNGRVFAFAMLVSVFFAYATWLANNAAGLWIDRRFPPLKKNMARLSWLVAWCLFSNSVACLLLYGSFRLADSPALPLHPSRLLLAWLLNVFIIFMVIALYDGIRMFENWERTLRETEQLKKANLQSQYESLKSQINPHFLFNSLNTLSSLIEEDPRQAERFVEEMASVYRYLLRSNETQMACLADELTFAQSYFHLLRTRYGTCVYLEQAVATNYHAHLLPPLTLQLLIENAVKHNVILPEQPLRICIETATGQRLVVRNNLQRKNTRVASNRIGLANIATQYRLLGGGELMVEEDECYFTVSLPLIGPR